MLTVYIVSVFGVFDEELFRSSLSGLLCDITISAQISFTGSSCACVGAKVKSNVSSVGLELWIFLEYILGVGGAMFFSFLDVRSSTS